MIKHVSTLYGRECEIWPTMYFLFAFESQETRPVLTRYFELNHFPSPPLEQRIDMICALNEYVIFHKLADGMFDALPAPDSQPVCLSSTRSLLLFFTLLSRYLNQAEMPNFNFLPYLGNLTFGVATENPSAGV